MKPRSRSSAVYLLPEGSLAVRWYSCFACWKSMRYVVSNEYRAKRENANKMALTPLLLVGKEFKED